MKAYFGYIRVSTKRQGAGASLSQQKTAITEYAAKRHLAIIEWFVEQETAAKQGRTQFTKMMAGLEADRAQGVIIHKIDRSARNLRDWVQLGELFDRGVDVQFAHEGLDLTTRAGRLTGDLLAVIAADFIRNNREEVLKGFYGRLNQGLYPLRAPLGYLDCGKGKPKTIDPTKGPLVRQMFELYASGRYSLWTLRAEMKRRGLRNHAGKVLSVNSTTRALHNSFHIGIIKIERRGETFQGVHRPLVPKRTFDRVQLILAGRCPKRVNKHDFTFRRRITCTTCGRHLYGELQKGHTYYRCHGRNCGGTSFRETTVEERVRDLLALIAFDEEEMRDLRDVGDEEKAKDETVEQTRIANLTRLTGLCDDRLIRLTDALLDGAIDKPTFEDRKERLLHERREVQDAIANSEGSHGSAALIEKLELGNTALLGFGSLDAIDRRDAVELAVSNLTAEGKELAVTLQFPFDRIAAARKSKLCAPCWSTPRNGSKSCEARNGSTCRYSSEEITNLFLELRDSLPAYLAGPAAVERSLPAPQIL
jgi:DNA invertase Pin-like site-specific DNA recombinase